MSRSRVVSVALLAIAGLCIVAGVFGLFGVFVALIVAGCLLIGAELLVPSR